MFQKNNLKIKGYENKDFNVGSFNGFYNHPDGAACQK